jgi:hypothetical protein
LCLYYGGANAVSANLPLEFLAIEVRLDTQALVIIAPD